MALINKRIESDSDIESVELDESDQSQLTEVWWERNPAWSNGERIHTDCLLLQIYIDEPDEFKFDASEVFTLASSFLTIKGITRLMRTCFYLSNHVPIGCGLSHLSFQHLAKNHLPNTPNKLRAEIFRSRVRQKDWGKMAPEKIPEGGWFSCDYVEKAVVHSVSIFQDVSEVNLRSVNLTIKSVEAVTTLPNLSTLLLDRTHISNISALGNCGNLQTLTLRRTPVNDITPLASCTSLIKLDLGCTPVTRINAIGGCFNLLHLDLTHSTICDINGIDALLQLIYLDLTGTAVLDISPIGYCTQLQHLSLASTNVIALSPLRSCQVLSYLNLKQTPVRYLDALLDCPSLSKLIVADTQVKRVNPLRKCFLLKYLDLTRTRVEDNDVLGLLLQACPMLKLLIGSEGNDLLKDLTDDEKHDRKTSLQALMYAASVFRHIQRNFRAKMVIRRQEEAKALEEATLLARAVGNVDAFGNVVLDD